MHFIYIYMYIYNYIPYWLFPIGPSIGGLVWLSAQGPSEAGCTKTCGVGGRLACVAKPWAK